MARVLAPSGFWPSTQTASRWKSTRPYSLERIMARPSVSMYSFT